MCNGENFSSKHLPNHFIFKMSGLSHSAHVRDPKNILNRRHRDVNIGMSKMSVDELSVGSLPSVRSTTSFERNEKLLRVSNSFKNSVRAANIEAELFRALSSKIDQSFSGTRASNPTPFGNSGISSINTADLSLLTKSAAAAIADTEVERNRPRLTDTSVDTYKLFVVPYGQYLEDRGIQPLEQLMELSVRLGYADILPKSKVMDCPDVNVAYPTSALLKAAIEMHFGLSSQFSADAAFDLHKMKDSTQHSDILMAKYTDNMTLQRKFDSVLSILPMSVFVKGVVDRIQPIWVRDKIAGMKPKTFIIAKKLILEFQDLIRAKAIVDSAIGSKLPPGADHSHGRGGGNKYNKYTNVTSSDRTVGGISDLTNPRDGGRAAVALNVNDSTNGFACYNCKDPTHRYQQCILNCSVCNSTEFHLYKV